MAEATFNASKLDWNWGDNEDSKRQHWLYRRLLSVRRKDIVPRLAGMSGESGHYQLLSEKVVRVWWTLGDGSELSMVANVGTKSFEGVGVWGEDHLWLEGSASGDTLDGLSVVFSLKQSTS
nr:DUF3459 domain-containing protein [Devosia aurantiaca]